METVTDFIFLGSTITADGDCSHEIKRHLLFGRKAMTNLDIEKQRHYFNDKGMYSPSYGFFSSHVCMWELDCKESWAPKNWCFQTVVLEKTLESPLDSKEIKLVNPKGNQSRIFIGRIDAEAKAPILFHLMQRADSLEKTLILGKIEKGETEDEMVGWHHWLNGHESEQTLGDNEGQGSLVCCTA